MQTTRITAAAAATLALTSSLLAGPPEPGAIRCGVEPIAPGGCCVEPAQLPNWEAMPRIQIAICLDTSGSMTGLINQARTRIWAIVNELTKAHANGQRARLEIGLYRYGSAELPATQGYLRQLTPLSTDLDVLSRELFALSTGGSEEFCGWVMNSANTQLRWDKRNASSSEAPVLRAIIIAGNEEFTQGPVAYQSVVEAAVNDGILVNTIYCGSDAEGQATGWLHAAHLAGGTYHAFDHNQQVFDIPAPQDEEIARLNSQLNDTYIAFGTAGRQRVELQREQDDANMGASAGAFAERAAAKSGEAYNNADWDLVDAVEEGTASPADMPAASLPAEMRTMSKDERIVYVQRKTEERRVIQEKITTLVKEREAFICKHRPDDHGETLDSAIIRSIREQAIEAGFSFPAPGEPD